MWIKDFEGTLINLNTMSGITIQKLNGVHVLILRNNDGIKDIGLCQSTVRSKLEVVYNHIEECISNGVPLVDVKKYVIYNSLWDVEEFKEV